MTTLMMMQYSIAFSLLLFSTGGGGGVAAMAVADGNDKHNDNDDICFGKETVATHLNFFDSTVTENKLHDGNGGVLRYENIGFVNDRPIDFVVSVVDGTTYGTTKALERNGKANQFGSINVMELKDDKLINGEANLEFCLYDHEKRNELVTAKSFRFSIYDVDERNAAANGIKEKITMDATQIKDFILYPNPEESEIELSCEDGSTLLPCDIGVRTIFHSTTKGTGGDNPKDPNDLDEVQKKRSIVYSFKDTSCFTMTLSHYCPVDLCQWYGGGNFLFSGDADQLIEEGECITTSTPPPIPTNPPTTGRGECENGFDNLDDYRYEDNQSKDCDGWVATNPKEHCAMIDETNEDKPVSYYCPIQCIAKCMPSSTETPPPADDCQRQKILAEKPILVETIGNGNHHGGKESYNSYVQHGCTTYYNTGWKFRAPNTRYEEFSAETCSEACIEGGYEYFGFECPMSNDVHCQCYTAATIGDKPVEEAVCKDRVGKDGNKHCTGPAMMDGISLGGADMGSIYAVGSRTTTTDQQFATTTTATTASSSYSEEAVQIISQDSDSVTFSVSQLWMEQGTHMISVQYRDVNKGHEVCDMDAPDDGGLVKFDVTKEYTAECTNGYTDIGIYLFVGESFDADECESCTVSDTENYVGYYLTLPCIPVLCDETASPITAGPTTSPTTMEPTTSPSKTPTVTAFVIAAVDTPAPTAVDVKTNPPTVVDDDIICPDDVKLIRQHGITSFPNTAAVTIVSQDTSTVTVALEQAWTSSSVIDSIYYDYKEDLFDSKCYEETNVELGVTYDTITIQCNVITPMAHLQICVADDITNDFLQFPEDDATIPQCCHSTTPEDTPVVCYTLEINCDTECVEEESTTISRTRTRRRNLLRGGSGSGGIVGSAA